MTYVWVLIYAHFLSQQKQIIRCNDQQKFIKGHKSLWCCLMTDSLQWKNKSSAVAEMGDHLATIDIGRKEGGCCAPFRGSWASSNTMWLGPRSTCVPNGILIHPAVWPQQTWAVNWGLCPLRGAGFPSNTTSPGPRPTSILSGRLVHPAVWSQQTCAENWGLLCPFLGRGSWVPM